MNGQIPNEQAVAGLTVRDYFAAAAMQGQINMEGMEGCDKELIAAMSYELADAMLAQRAKSQEVAS